MTEDDRLDAAFSALAHPARRAILAQLARGKATVNSLAEPFEMSLPAVSKHIRVLENAGLITCEIDAQFRPCTIETKPVVSQSFGFQLRCRGDKSYRVRSRSNHQD